ncbi:MAG: 2-(1,2-epoxy-1,2-dihydrophenyl)acetyl-CoA isomerase [Chloroflexota bacterium]|nr:MAG: 2-(1,2-epoxy-1,2-dihydrophenyl)acetyl-CoA isomerase [Chloroflexota bacterium]
MSYTKLLFQVDSGVAVITLNRPDKSNAFDDEMTRELLDALKQIERDSAIRAIVLTGAGKNFCAGQDLAAFLERQNSPEGLSVREHLLNGYNKIVTKIRTIEKPFIAAVNGAAAGAGLGICCACDLRYASEIAKFRMAFIGIGLAPDSGTSFLLPRIVGYGRALEMALTNELVDAREAYAFGLANKIFPPDELMDATMNLAKQLANAPTRGIGLTKRAFNRALVTDLDGALDYEAFIQNIAVETQDHQEGVNAFLEKRAAAYTGK